MTEIAENCIKYYLYCVVFKLIFIEMVSDHDQRLLVVVYGRLENSD